MDSLLVGRVSGFPCIFPCSQGICFPWLYAVSLPTSADAKEPINAETSALEQLDAAV
jgi:hypothetical protein